MGHPDKTEEMYRIGFGFGSIVFLLDAIEDFEKDRKQAVFNAISVSYGFDKASHPLSASHRFQVEAILLDYQREIIECLSNLPISQEKIDLFSHRLRVNLKSRIKRSNPEKETMAVCSSLEPPPKRRFALSHSAPVRYLRHNRFLQASLFVLSIPFQYGLLAFAVPAQKQDTQGSQDTHSSQQGETLSTRKAAREPNSCCLCCCDTTECCMCSDCACSSCDANADLCSCCDGCSGCDGCCDCCSCCDC